MRICGVMRGARKERRCSKEWNVVVDFLVVLRSRKGGSDEAKAC